MEKRVLNLNALLLFYNQIDDTIQNKHHLKVYKKGGKAETQ